MTQAEAPPRISHQLRHEEHSPTRLQDSNLQNFIDFTSGFMHQSDSESHMFVQGAKYAGDLLAQYDSFDTTNISNDTIAEFLVLANHTATQKSRQRSKDNRSFDPLNILEKMDGKTFIQDVVSFSSKENSDLAAHFNDFENPFTKLGAFTVLTLTEMESKRINLNQEVKLQPSIEYHLLKSA